MSGLSNSCGYYNDSEHYKTDYHEWQPGLQKTSNSTKETNSVTLETSYCFRNLYMHLSWYAVDPRTGIEI